MKEFRGHTSYVNGATYNKDGSHVLTASSDGTVKLWDAKTTDCLLTFRPGAVPGGPVREIAVITIQVDAPLPRMPVYASIYYLSRPLSAPLFRPLSRHVSKPPPDIGPCLTTPHPRRSPSPLPPFPRPHPAAATPTGPHLRGHQVAPGLHPHHPRPRRAQVLWCSTHLSPTPLPHPPTSLPRRSLTTHPRARRAQLLVGQGHGRGLRVCDSVPSGKYMALSGPYLGPYLAPI